MPTHTPLKKFEVTYRNKSGDMTTKKSEATGQDNRTVQEQFESRGYQVIAVVDTGLVQGKSVRTS